MPVRSLLRFAATMILKNLSRPHLAVASAWALHTVSWFLPVINPELYGPIRGWFAFRSAFSAVWPYQDMHFDTWYGAVLSTLSAVTTLLFILISPWMVWRGSRSALKASAWVAAVSFVINSHWYVLFASDRKSLAIGYFLWWLSFGLLAIGLFGLSIHHKIDDFGEPRRIQA